MLIPVILSGGAGTRLWPVSREGHPKPFMTLPDGQTLCATVPLAQAVGLEEGADATAYFNADRVIIATLC